MEGKMAKFQTRFMIFFSIIFLVFSYHHIFSVEIPESIKVRMQIDNSTARINDRIVTLDAPPKIINNRTFVPIRFISEAFGAKVDWDSGLRMVTITLDNPEFYLNESIQKAAEINLLKDQISSKDDLIKSLNIEIKKKGAEIDLLKTENRNLKDELIELQNIIVSLKNEIESLKNGNSGSEIDKKGTKIFIDGMETPTKSEVILYKGKVYASLEDICPALGKAFNWDETKNIFHIYNNEGSEGKKPFENDIGKRFEKSDFALTVNSTSISDGTDRDNMKLTINMTMENLGELTYFFEFYQFKLQDIGIVETWENIPGSGIKKNEKLNFSVSSNIDRAKKNLILEYYYNNFTEHIEIKLDR
jgi:hypothetical protein